MINLDSEKSRVLASNLVSVFLVFILMGGISRGFMTDASLVWYYKLSRSSFNPPGFVFGFVWSLLMLIMTAGISLVIYEYFKSRVSILSFLLSYLGYIISVSFWGYFFWLQHNLLLGLVGMVASTFFMALSALTAYTINKSSGFMLGLTVLWLCFATFLTWKIYILN